MKLGICITTYNRQREVLRLVHRLRQTLRKYPNVVIVIRPDGGNVELLDLVLPNLGNQVIYERNTLNEGVYRSKYKTILAAVNQGCDWVIHCDDDDYLDPLTLDYILRNSVHSDCSIIQFNVSKINQKTGGYQDRFSLQSSAKKNCMCLNGLLMKSSAIKLNMIAYPETDLYNYGKHEVWGDDCFIAGYLCNGIDDDKIGLENRILGYQEYFDEDQHICNDPTVYKKTRSYMKKFLRHVKLPKF